jgi:hypothetical protein
MSLIESSSTRTASEGHATVGKNPVTVRRIDDLIARGLSLVSCHLILPLWGGEMINPYRAVTVPGF